MYGMVNKAIQAMVLEQYGEDKWDEVLKKANVGIDVFVSMDAYPDEITYKIVGAISEVLNISASNFLEELGVFWVKYTSEGDYKDLFDMAGDNFITFMLNINDLHTRVASILTKLKPPSFKCTDIQKDSVHLHYYSDRKGLTPMVIGLIKGLGKKFNTRVEISQLSNKDQGADHDEFLIKYSSQ